VDIVVTGRNVEVPEHYRIHVAEKLSKVERYDGKIIGIGVELSHEKNPRQSDRCQRVEITCTTRGPVVRAEACSGDFYSALDAAVAKLDSRLRRSADRRRVHRGRRTPISVGAATSGLAATDLDGFALPDETLAGVGAGVLPSMNGSGPLSEEPDDQPWHIVRQKEHPTEPMTVDDALFQMELVGHDFYLFLDKESGRPSVVYRRRAYDYGVISLA